MNQQIFKGQWHEIKGKIKSQWGELTEDELAKIEGNNQEILGFLQKHYGFAKDEAEEQVNHFVRNLSHSMTSEGGILAGSLKDQLTDLTAEVKKLIALRGKAAVCTMQQNPLASIGAALSVGVILGWLFGRK